MNRAWVFLHWTQYTGANAKPFRCYCIGGGPRPRSPTSRERSPKKFSAPSRAMSLVHARYLSRPSPTPQLYPTAAAASIPPSSGPPVAVDVDKFWPGFGPRTKTTSSHVTLLCSIIASCDCGGASMADLVLVLGSAPCVCARRGHQRATMRSWMRTS